MAHRDNDPFELEAMIALRHDLHAHPELGFEETRTSDIVANQLAEAGITVHRGLGRTGVVATLKVGNGTSRIALRADMDALAMPELTELSYKSTTANTDAGAAESRAAAERASAVTAKFFISGIPFYRGRERGGAAVDWKPIFVAMPSQARSLG